MTTKSVSRSKSKNKLFNDKVSTPLDNGQFSKLNLEPNETPSALIKLRGSVHTLRMVARLSMNSK